MVQVWRAVLSRAKFDIEVKGGYRRLHRRARRAHGWAAAVRGQRFRPHRHHRRCPKSARRHLRQSNGGAWGGAASPSLRLPCATV